MGGGGPYPLAVVVVGPPGVKTRPRGGDREKGGGVGRVKVRSCRVMLVSSDEKKMKKNHADSGTG